jgi:autotransporter-associated beta strand protein
MKSPILKSGTLAALTAILGIGSASSQVAFDSFAAYTEDFNGFRGTEATLPAGFSITAGGTNIFREVFNSTTSAASDFTGIMGATSDSTNHALAWRESTGAASLDDARVMLAITNNTGSPIYGFEVNYDLQAWVNGRRDNQIRLKYDVYPDSASAPGRNAFETDVWALNSDRTKNPNHTPIAANGDQFVLNGQAVGNFFPVSGTIDLTTLLVDEADPNNGVFGPLQAGETAYFRWQISNNQLTSGNRSALGIDNLSITPLATPPPSAPELEWKPGVGGSGIWAPTGGTNWDGGEWEQGASALFNGTPGEVTLDGAIEATDVNLNSGYTLVAGPGATLFVDGMINVADSVAATLAAPLRNNGQLRKQGDGTLLLSGAQTHTGPTNIFSGTLRTVVGNAHSPNAVMTIDPNAVFDLNGTTQTIGGLNGQRDGLVQLGNGGTLIIDTQAGSHAYRANLEGAGNVIKRGPGTQRFRSEEKTYTGFTRIEEGVLQVTGNGKMADTSMIEVMPNGELFFVGDSASGAPPSGFGGPIRLLGGRLALENTGEATLYYVDTEVQVLVDDSTINVSGAGSTGVMDSGTGGEITGDKIFRKTGAGLLEIEGSHSHTGGMEIRNGSVQLFSGSSIGAGPLIFTQSGNIRSFASGANAHTVTKLDGNAPDPNDEDAENTLVLNIGGNGATFTVDQAIELDEDQAEVTTRFQGDITGAGSFVKSGDGFLAFTRWPKTYTGETVVAQGVLAVSQSATPSATSGVTVQSGGQLRLTSAGADVSYTFGGTITLAGNGRGGDVLESSGQGILGALRCEPGTSEEGSTATLTNSIVFDAGDGVRLHVSGGNNTLELAGTLSESSSGQIAKSGGGNLRIAAANAGLASAWMIDNGTLEIAGFASTGSGTVTIGEGGAITGTGTVGGSLALLEGGALATTTDISGPLLVTGGFSAEEDSIVTVAGTLSENSITILTATGGITGVGNLQVAGLEGSGYSGTLSVDGNNLILTLSEEEPVTGNSFAQWAGGVGPDEDVNGNGFPALLEFAFGASAPGEPFPRPVQGKVVMNDIEYLTLTAAIRTNAPGLVVTGETSIDLGIDDAWDGQNVDHVATGNPDVPANTEERIYRTPMNGTARFIRLRAVANPAP